MNRLAVIFVLAAFFGIAVLGFFAMAHAGGHEHGGCIGATSQGATCPEADPLASAGFHSSAFRGFSQAVINGSSANLLLALGALFSVFGLVALVHTLRPLPLAHSRFNQFIESYTAPRRRLASWLSLLETSPTFA